MNYLYVSRFKIEAYEEVFTKAGMFKAFRISWGHEWSDPSQTGHLSLWWSPDVKGFVKVLTQEERATPGWVGDFELESYTLTSTVASQERPGQSGPTHTEKASASPPALRIVPHIPEPPQPPQHEVKAPATRTEGAPPPQLPRETAPSVPLSLRTNAYAVVIGIDYAGRGDMPPLRYAATDAQKMYELLTDPKVGGLPKEHVTLLLNHQATRAEIIAAVQGVLGRTPDPHAHIYIYYSGHGAPKLGSTGRLEDGYLVPYDVKLDNRKTLDYTALRFSDLRRDIEEAVVGMSWRR